MCKNNLQSFRLMLFKHGGIISEDKANLRDYLAVKNSLREEAPGDLVNRLIEGENPITV
jgi:hypothetical protein